MSLILLSSGLTSNKFKSMSSKREVKWTALQAGPIAYWYRGSGCESFTLPHLFTSSGRHTSFDVFLASSRLKCLCSKTQITDFICIWVFVQLDKSFVVILGHQRVVLPPVALLGSPVSVVVARLPPAASVVAVVVRWIHFRSRINAFYNRLVY